MNSYYTRATTIIPYSRSKPSDVETPLDYIEDGFDKLVDPHPTKKGFGAPVPMSDGTALDEGVTAGQVVGSTLTYAADTGAANAYVVALDVAPVAYADGIVAMFRAVNENTGAATLNVNGLGVKSLTDYAGRALLAGDILAGSVVLAVYDDGKFKIISHFDQYDGSAAAYALAAQSSASDSLASAGAADISEANALASANAAALVYSNMIASYISYATFIKYQW